MSKILIYENIDKKKFPPYSVISIPKYINFPKYTKFKNFLENNKEGASLWPSCNNRDVGALEVNHHEVIINLNKCIGCLMCLSSQKNLENLVQEPKEIISKIYTKIFLSLFDNKKIFYGKILNFPYFTNRKTNSFEEFTNTKETEHISIWASSVLNFLASSKKSRIGKEIEIMKRDTPRDGRLDVCIDNVNCVLVGECKTNLDYLLAENKYIIQLPGYYKECKKFLDEYNEKYNLKKRLMIFLIIGGRETDLLPSDHAYCSSNVGNKSERFYRDLTKFGIKFISANAILTMILFSIYNKKRLCWDILLNSLLEEENFIGLVSGGMIIKKQDRIILKEISRSLINFAERAFS